MKKLRGMGAAAKPSFFASSGTIVFWSFFMIAQFYLFFVYHTIRLTDFTTSQSVTTSKQQADFRQDFEVRKKPLQQSKFEKPKKPKKPKIRSIDEADGTFNGYPIYKLRRDAPKSELWDGASNNNNINLNELYSQFHCVGETWHNAEHHRRTRTNHEQSWMYRSCRFQVFCYDTAVQEYAIYLDPEKHQDSHSDHHYHHGDTTNDKNNSNPHPSPHIQKILETQKQQLDDERAQVNDENHERNTATDFKHPTFLDDTSTVFRNHTVVVNSHGKIVLGDTEQGKHYGVSIGSVNGKWGLIDIQKLKWFPEVRWGPIPGTAKDTTNSNSDYEVYMLPPSVTMIPFHSLSAENPGHLVWDDFLPMYTLLDMFGFLNKRDASGRAEDSETNHPHDTSDWTDLLPMRYKLPNMARGLWASCDWLDEKRMACEHMLSKFGIALGSRRSYKKFHGDTSDASDMVQNPNGISNPKTASKLPKIPITTNRDVELELKDKPKRLGETSNSDETPKLICAKNAFAGFGAIADHLPNHGHGWQSWDYLFSYNSGRANQLWEFRNFMIHNLFESLPKKPAPIVPIPSSSTPQNEMRRRLAYNVKRLESLTSRPSVLLGKEQITSYPLSSITDLGPEEPLVVLFSAYSSMRRGGSMELEAQLLKDAIEESGGAYQFLYGRPPTSGDVGGNLEIVIENHVFSKYTVEEQIQMASRSAMFLTFCGGGAITGSFLPKGAGMYLYYGEDSGIEHNRPTELPARLDWDFFNHCGYLHVKWLPFFDSQSRKFYSGIAGGYESQAMANVDLMRADLRRIHTERIKHYQAQKKS